MHIDWSTQVMEQIGERTRDFIQANAGVELTRKLGTDAKMTPQELAMIVKQLPVSASGGRVLVISCFCFWQDRRRVR